MVVPKSNPVPQLQEKPHDQLFADLRDELASSQVALQAAQNNLLDSQEKLNDALRDLKAKRLALNLDHADGAERQQRGSNPLVIEISRSDRRWEDDGGSAAGTAPRIVAADEYATKPTWSVQSLRDLLSAIRASKSPATNADAQEDAETKTGLRQASSRKENDM